MLERARGLLTEFLYRLPDAARGQALAAVVRAALAETPWQAHPEVVALLEAWSTLPPSPDGDEEAGVDVEVRRGWMLLTERFEDPLLIACDRLANNLPPDVEAVLIAAGARGADEALRRAAQAIEPVWRALWEACEEPDGLLWPCSLWLDAPSLVRAACACARAVLPLAEDGSGRAAGAIEAAEAWCNGGESDDEAWTAANEAAEAADEAAVAEGAVDRWSGGATRTLSRQAAFAAAYAVVAETDRYAMTALEAATDALALAATRAGQAESAEALRVLADALRSALPWPSLVVAIEQIFATNPSREG